MWRRRTAASAGSTQASPASRRLRARPLAVLVALTVVVVLVGPALHPVVAQAAVGGDEGDDRRDRLARFCLRLESRLDDFLAERQRRRGAGETRGRDRGYHRPPHLSALVACRLFRDSPGGRGDPDERRPPTRRPPEERSPPPEKPGRQSGHSQDRSRPPPGAGVPDAPAPAAPAQPALASRASGLDPLIVAAVLVLVMAGIARLAIPTGGIHGARHEKRRRVDRLLATTVAVLRHSALPRPTSRSGGTTATASDRGPRFRMTPTAMSITADFLERAGWTAGQQFVAVALATGPAARVVHFPWTAALTAAGGAAIASGAMTAIQYRSNLTGLTFWPDLLARLAKTFLASQAGSFGGDAVGVLDVDWPGALGLATIATLGAAAKGLLARQSANRVAGTPSTLPTQTYTTAVTARSRAPAPGVTRGA